VEEAQLEQAREWLRAASSVAVLTGAGISAESGVPTFRGSGGLWKHYKPEDLATPEAFARDPRLVWEWYDWRRGLIGKAEPNPGHMALVLIERAKPRFTLITQNVDGLHDQAGSSRVLKLHGDIWRMRCTVCGSEWPDRRVPLPKLPPHCGCGGLARPAVVWFGEPLVPGIWGAAQDAASSADVFLVVGTSAGGYPAAGLIDVARHAGARVIEVNPELTQFSAEVDACVTGTAGRMLPELVEYPRTS
jgi:NAD-dependent deacetylase